MNPSAALILTGFQRFLAGLVDLVRFDRGSATFVVDDAGEFVHTETVVTVKMLPGETLEQFHQRVRRDYGLRKGDKIEVLNNNRQCDTMRLTLQPR
jgi:hypothetical protein